MTKIEAFKKATRAIDQLSPAHAGSVVQALSIIYESHVRAFDRRMRAKAKRRSPRNTK